MNKNAKLLGAVALSLGTIFSSGCASLGPRNAENDNPATSDVDGLSQIFNRVSRTPMTMVDRPLAKKLMEMGQRDKISPIILLSHKIQLETGIEPSKRALQTIGSLISNNTPASFRIPKDEKGPNGEMQTENLCYVYANLPGDAEKGPVQSMLQIDEESLAKAIPTLDASKIIIPTELAERIVKLHEGFHCADKWFAPERLKTHLQIQESSGNYRDDHELRLKQEMLTHRSETFADVAMVLKMAQEGHKDIIAAHVAIRSIAQTHMGAENLSNPTFAVRVLARESGLRVDQETGWPDNLTYIQVPGLAHNTTKGVLAAQDYINSRWDWQLKQMSMEDIMNKAREITEATALSADQFRGLSYTLWSAPREEFGETVAPIAEQLCPPPCASAITDQQREIGKAALEDYQKTLKRALAPFIKGP
jgi:hypothetical protein